MKTSSRTPSLFHALALGFFVIVGSNSLRAQPSALTRPHVTAEGEFEFNAASPQGRKRIERSTDLRAWSAVVTTNETAFSVRQAALAGAERFFRVVCDDPPTIDDLELTATASHATQVTLRWRAVPGAVSARVYLSAEPCCANAGLPAQKLLATLSGSATEFTLTQLAPSLHHFLRVTVDTTGVSHSSIAHARTAGGPRAVLDDSVREVLGWTPSALEVVLTATVNGTNDSGLDLQSGWRVTRASGVPIRVNAVHRHSVPIGAPAYGMGPEPSGDPNVVEVDHRLFLMLGEPIGSPEILTVDGPRGIHFTAPFSDRYLETPVIQLNQVGYNPRATQRYAYVSGWMGDGGPLDLAGFPASADVLVEGAGLLTPRAPVVRPLAVTLRRAMDSDAGTEVREIDLASVPAAERARYRVRLPGVGVSWPTAVSEQAAFKAFFTVTRALFHNRWGGNLATNFTEWSRPADHPTVFTAESTDFYEMYPPATPRTGERPLAGGHHDAGDFDQQLTHTKIPELLMRAYEVAPEAFVDGQLILPESGNGIPDLLDEALWNVAAWEQLQEVDGGVRLGVESFTHPPNQGVLAHTDALPYWTYGVGAHHTARCSGMFAQAARLVAPFDPVRSARLRQRAVDAFRYATGHDAAPAALIWGASELFRFTGETVYRDRTEAIWSSLWTDGSFPFAHLQLDNADFRENINIPADYWMGYLTASNTSPTIAGQQRGLIDLYAAFRAEEIHAEHAHRNSRPEGYNFGFGQGTVVEKYLDPIYARLQFIDVDPAEQQRGFDALSLAADFVLGGNPNGLVYFTGLGTRRVEEPLHLDSLAFIKLGKGPIPGIPAYGPSDEIYCDWCDWTAATRAAFHPAFMSLPRARRFGDNRLLIINTEFSSWECMAPHAELFAALMRGTRGVMPPASYRPGGGEHRNPLP